MSEVVVIPFAPVPDKARSVMVPMRDGVRLATDIYLPEGTQSDLPAILVRLPYDKCGEYCFMPRIEAAFTTSGYAFVVQDVRGRTRSEGATFPFISEVADGYDTLEWIAQQPWSSGAVGMIGESYYGFTAWCAAASRHAALKAIAPRVTAANLGMAMEPGGDDAETFALSVIVPWLSYVWIDNGMYEAEFDWSIRPLRDAFAAATKGRRSAGYAALLRRPFSDPSWMKAVYGSRDPYEIVDIPVLHWAGWWDNCQYGQFRAYRRMCGRPEVRDWQYLIADAVDHEGFSWDEAPRPALDQLEFEEGAHSSSEAEMVAFVEEYRESLPFFDRFVRGVDGPALPRVRWMLAGEGWRESQSWPPPESHEVEFHLVRGAAALEGVDDGGLAPHPATADERVEWIHDPSDLVPELILNEWHPLGPGLPDECVVEERPDVLTFTGDPLTAPLRIAGPVTLGAACRSTFHTLHLVAKLCDVDADGYARRLLLGITAVHEPDFDRLVEVDLGDTGFVVEAGHRLRLDIAASCLPRFLWHPGTDESPWDAVEGQPQTQSIVVGGSQGARLRLRVIE
jgi:hypothetical protein